jgi:hypothetical protein
MKDDDPIKGQTLDNWIFKTYLIMGGEAKILIICQTGSLKFSPFLLTVVCSARSVLARGWQTKNSKKG